MFIWLLFFVGQVVHVMAQIETVVRTKTNPANSRLQILKDGWFAFVIRAFVCTMLFGVFLSGELPTVLLAFKIESPLWVEALSAVMNSAAGPFIAGAFGYSIDSLLAYIPGLKSYVPQE